MCKIIYDNEKRELKGIEWDINYIRTSPQSEGRHIIADDNLLHGR